MALESFLLFMTYFILTIYVKAKTDIFQYWEDDIIL
jgi:hypothetical protein